MMDPHQVTEPPQAGQAVVRSPAEEVSVFLTTDTVSVVDQEVLEDKASSACTSEDVNDDDAAQGKDSASDVDGGGSDYLPNDAKDDGESDDDITSSRKKQAKKVDTNPVDMTELHDEWNNWVDIYRNLLNKRKTKTLTNHQKRHLAYSRNSLEALMKQIPASDPLKSSYSQLLDQTQSASPTESRKRKNDKWPTGQVKKARLEISTQGRSSLQRVVPQSTTKKATATAIQQHFQRIVDQDARTGSHSTRGKSEVSNMKKALQAFGGEKLVKLQDGCWLVHGMKTPLFGYQFDGAGWMVQQERSRTNPNGGILADEMGCGKTITMLSVIIRGKVAAKASVKSNLLLVQSEQMANQWMDQIDKHCSEESLPASRWGRNSRLNAALIGGEQIIVITYSDVERAWSRVNQVRQKGKKGSTGSALKTAQQDLLLFRTRFHRIILDECQQIKNHISLTAKAVFQLEAKFKWLLSATPAPNREDEYYSYLKILQLPHTETLRDFHQHWTSLPEEGGPTELERGLERFLLRRSRQTRFAGVRIFDGVPDSVEQTLSLSLSAEERVFYNVVVEPLRTELKKKQEQLAKKDIEALKDTADVKGASGGYMVSKILSLYKLTAHPFLLESILLSDEFPVDQLRDIRDRLNKLHYGDRSMLLDQAEHIAGSIVEEVDAGQSVLPESRSHAIAPQPITDNGVFNMDCQMNYALGEKATERKCRFCPGETIPISAILAQCGHCFCQKHFDINTRFSQIDKPDSPILCPVCAELIGEIQNVDQTDLAAAHATYKAGSTSGTRRERKSSKAKGKAARKRGDDFNGCQPRGERSRFLELSDRDHPLVPLVHSAKTRDILKTILRWQDDAPDDKIIVFTQWLVMGKIVGRLFEDAGINFLYYFGAMTSAERTQSLDTFKAEKDVKVIIMGFKCASQGLDMPHANRVILVDPWWNEDGENQAFARVLRKVQTKTTFFIRLMIKESIDMRISDIQQSKREMTERLMKEDDPWKRATINLEYTEKILNHCRGPSTDKREAVAAHEAQVVVNQHETASSDTKQETTPENSVQTVATTAEQGRRAAVEA